jgi:hypothetical protein
MKKFQDDLNTSVFTTKSVFRKNEAIKFVFHHEEDGAWEFIGNSSYEEQDYIVVSLEEIITLDKTVLDIADLPLGFEARRAGPTSEWEICRSD